MLNAGGGENGQVIAGTDDQQMVSEYVGYQRDKAPVLDVEHEAARHAPMPVGKFVSAVRKMLHETSRAESPPEVYRIEGRGGAGSGIRSRGTMAPEKLSAAHQRAVGLT